MTTLKSREYHLRRTYGLTIAEYNRLLGKQDGKCGVCKRSHDTFKVNLAVDHDHRSGEIYGLLCTYCNRRVIGRERNPEIYKNAYEYLSKGTVYFVPPKTKKTRKKKRKKR